MSWYESARVYIRKVHESLPETATYAERRKAVQDAYPWGERRYHPYKMWCKAQREYLGRFKNDPPGGMFAKEAER